MWYLPGARSNVCFDWSQPLVTKFFDCGPATFSDQAVEVHAYEAASPFTSPDDHCPVSWVSILCDAVPQMSSLNPFAFIGLAALLADLAH